MDHASTIRFYDHYGHVSAAVCTTKTLYTRVRATDGSTMLEPMGGPLVADWDFCRYRHTNTHTHTVTGYIHTDTQSSPRRFHVRPRDDIPMSLLLGGGGFHTMSGCSVWGGVWESECNRLSAVDETGV